MGNTPGTCLEVHCPLLSRVMVPPLVQQRQAVLPARANVVVELTGDLGQQTIAPLIEGLAETVAVEEGHGRRRSALGWGLEGIDQAEAGDGFEILAVAGDQGEVVQQSRGCNQGINGLDAN